MEVNYILNPEKALAHAVPLAGGLDWNLYLLHGYGTLNFKKS